jgi:deoxyinosine 3'endonuclease (endonuclease V)
MAHFERLHDWDVAPAEAVALQQQLRERVRLQPAPHPVRTIAGADISFDLGSETVYAGIVVLSLPGLQTLEETGVTSRATFPYVPGLLSFREAPALLEAWERLRVEPDAVMLDGQGVAHPRRLGIASHLGLFLQRPTLGCAKSKLVGRCRSRARSAGTGPRSCTAASRWAPPCARSAARCPSMYRRDTCWTCPARSRSRSRVVAGTGCRSPRGARICSSTPCAGRGTAEVFGLRAPRQA